MRKDQELEERFTKRMFAIVNTESDGSFDDGIVAIVPLPAGQSETAEASRAEAIAASGATVISLRGTAGIGGGRSGLSATGRGAAGAGTASGSSSRLIGSSPSAQSTPASR